MQLRIAAIATIYSKTLRLSSIGGLQATSSGQLCNLASNDVERFLYGALFLPYLYWGPVEAIAVLVIGLYRMGVAFAAGYAVLFFVVPLQFVLGNRFATFRSQVG
jgi:ATP-binding cassette, subfamily C (CFTR/MRP), member 4